MQGGAVTVPGNSPPGLDLDRAAPVLAEATGGALTDPLTGSVISGGRSNLTYVVSGGGTRVVVRRPPLGHVLPSAHDMAREYRVISALAGTKVPVPATYLLCEDTKVIGAPFYVMEKVDGTAYRTAAQLEAVGAARTRLMANRMIST